MQNTIKKLKLNTKDKVISLYVARILANLSSKYLVNKYDLFDEEYIELLGLEIIADNSTKNENYNLAKNIKVYKTRFSGDIKDRDSKKVIINYAKTIANNKIKIYNKTTHKNLLMLQSYLGLSDVDILILEFLSIASLNEKLTDFVNEFKDLTTDDLAKIIADAISIKKNLVIKKLSKNSLLIITGLIEIDKNTGNFYRKFDLCPGFIDNITMSNNSIFDIFNQAFYPADKPKLKLDNFDYIKEHNQNITQFLNNTKYGINVLIYGEPGTGKTEWVKAIADNKNLYEVANADEDDDPLSAKSRLQSYKVASNILSKDNNNILLFDEVEDIFGTKLDNIFSIMLSRNNKNSSKIWINRLLENSKLPTFWIANNIDHIDEAYLRRFDYIFEMKTPPKYIRTQIIKKELKNIKVSNNFINSLASYHNITPAMINTSANFIKHSNSKNAEKTMLMMINNTLKAQNKKQIVISKKLKYDVNLVNTNIKLANIVKSIKDSRQLRLCLYGLPGTGKTEFGHYLSDEINKPIIFKKASDLLSKYVGGSEENIARAFEEAKDENAILQIDEADSFLLPRSDAKNSWEITQVNEFLTQMEGFNGVLIASTNLINNFDKAAIRRFDIKAEFKPLNNKQKVQFLTNILQQNNIKINQNSIAKQLQNLVLTAGDFAVIMRKINILNQDITTNLCIDLLKEEHNFKDIKTSAIGFI